MNDHWNLPTISVVIPSYNCSGYLAKALDSALAQRYPHDKLEIVVVDDGSHDGSHTVAKEYARRDSRIIALSQRNGGPGSARNRGIAASSGELIAFLDCDDTWESTKLARQAALFQADAALGLVYCGCRFVDARGVTLEGWVRRQRATEGEALLEFFCDFFLITSAVIVPRRCLDAVGHFDSTLRVGEDNELFLRVLARYRIGCIDAPLLNRTVREDSLSREDYDLDARNDLLILDRFVRANPEFVTLHRARIDARYAGYLYDYGYRLLENGEQTRARSALTQSLRHRLSVGAARALIRSLLPSGAGRLLRA